MGLFRFIRTQVTNMANETEKAQLEAQDWDPRKIGDQLAGSGMLKGEGYAKALHDKCSTMSLQELGKLFDEFFYQKNMKAVKVLIPLMWQKGLLKKDQYGTIRRTYR